MNSAILSPTKRCLDCGLTKPREDFYLRLSASGYWVLYSRCKGCYNRKTGEKQKRYYGTAKRVAREKLRYAVRQQKIQKPGRCDECQEPTPPEKLDGHHHKGYENPLDVEWLCRPCHRSRH